MATLSTHVLSSVTGEPAAGMRVELATGSGTVLGTGETDGDGRLRDFPALEPGRYQLTFQTQAWFGDQPCFYPVVSITFQVDSADPGRHYHVPLLLAPYAYSTYRGS